MVKALFIDSGAQLAKKNVRPRCSTKIDAGSVFYRHAPSLIGEDTVLR